MKIAAHSQPLNEPAPTRHITHPNLRIRKTIRPVSTENTHRGKTTRNRGPKTLARRQLSVIRRSEVISASQEILARKPSRPSDDMLNQ